MLADPAVRYVVTGRVDAVEGLPETLLDADHEFEAILGKLQTRNAVTAKIEGQPSTTINAADVEVDVRLRVRNVLKPPGRCPRSPRVDDAARCERAEALPDEMALRIPSDWFLWPATGTSRRVARRAGRHMDALRELDRKRGIGEIGESEHAQAAKELKRWMEIDLERVTVEYWEASDDRQLPPRGGSISTRRNTDRFSRLLEDRRGYVKIGGEYLLALGAGEEGVARTHYRPAKLESSWHEYDYYVLWGDEVREVEIAMMLTGNCMLSKPRWVPREQLAYACHNYARGLATFWLYPDFQCRH